MEKPKNQLTRQEADAIVRFLEEVTEMSWWSIQREANAGKYDLDEIISAWKKLEDTAGLSGTVPSKSDFFE